MDIGKILNGICNYINREAEEASSRMEQIKEEMRQELRGYSDEKIKKLYQNREKMKSGARELVEEEVKRRKLRIR